MNRRTLLAALGTGAAAVAGCLDDDTDPGPTGDETDASGSDDSSDDSDSGDGTDVDDSHSETDGTETEGGDSPAYEPCDRAIVWYGELPGDVAAEVDAALEDGAYETDGELLYPRAIDVEAAALSTDDVYYAADIERDGETTTLRLEETTPTKPTPEDLVFRNETDEVIEVSVTVTREGGGDGAEGDGGEDDETVVLEEEGIEVDPRETHEDERRFPVTDEYGAYEIAVELADGRTVTESWRIQYVESNAVVTVEEDEIAVGSETILEVGPCPWNES